MKLYFAAASPFVRKAMVCAAELGLSLEPMPCAVGPVARDRAVIASNPLGQVPTLLTDEGMALYDSRVICEYLDSLAGGGRLFPVAGPHRWRALVEQSLGDGLLDAAVLTRYEGLLRPADKQWDAWTAGQMDKVATALDQMQAWAPALGSRADIGTITLGCALGYLDFRFPTLTWRAGRTDLAGWYEGFAARPSMVGSRPLA